MTGRAEIVRQQQKLDATFKRAAATTDAELLADLARYLCVLVAGFLEQAVIEVSLEHVRRHSQDTVLRHTEPSLRRFTSANSTKIIQLIGSFDPEWRKDLEDFLVDEYKDAINSVINLRHSIAHGKTFVGVTMAGIEVYYRRVKQAVDHIVNLCIP